MIVTCQSMKELETRAFAAGATAENLMEEVGAQIALAVRQFFPDPGCCRVVFGKGHNGGDGLVAARHLAAAGWEIALEPVFPREELAPLTLKELEILQRVLAHDSSPVQGRGYASLRRATIILDALLGIGAKPGLREPLRSATARINRLRMEIGAAVFAIDLPTGLDGDTGVAAPDAVVADFTLMIGFAKRGLFADAALDWVGRLAVLPLAALTTEAGQSRESVATPDSLAGLRPPRRFGLHKGDCGRVGIVAGSRGLTGAAVMAANAAVRAGAGLVSLYVTPDIYPIVAASTMPEVMTAPVDGYLTLLDKPFDVLAIGPGLGRLGDADDFLALIERFRGPMVVDADALNLLVGNLDILRSAAGPRLLTPHPGEMARLFPESATLTRRETAERFLESLAGAPVTLLLKGARTLVAGCIPSNALPSGPGGGDSAGAFRISYNTTGTPGMATGGMGDVLTGVCAALAAQGLSLFDSARAGAWLCGRSAELAVSHGHRSVESLSATDVPEYFGRAFEELRRAGN